MSDEEEEYSEEEVEEEEEEEQKPKKPPPPEKHEPEVQKTETELILEQKFAKKLETDEDQWKQYIDDWRRQRAKEEEDLRKLKEKQSKRRAQRETEEHQMTEQKRKQEEQRQREAEEKKQRELEQKKARLEEAERKRQAMQQAMDKAKAETKPNFVVQKRTDGGPGASLGNSAADRLLNVAAARGELGKTKEQLEEDKKISLSFRIQALEIEGLSIEQLKEKAKELWEAVVKLETEKYDLEERQKRQDYDLKELNERQRQINRNKALKKGLDPEALQGRHPPKLQVASKYERRIDRRSYNDKKNLYEGGWEAQMMGQLEKLWMDHMQSFEEKKGALPKWLGENPSKGKSGSATKDAAPPPAAAPEPVAVEEEEEEEE